MLFNSPSFNSTSVPWFTSTAFTSGTNATWYMNQKPDDDQGDDSGGGAMIPRNPRPPKGSPGTQMPLPDRELVEV